MKVRRCGVDRCANQHRIIVKVDLALRAQPDLLLDSAKVRVELSGQIRERCRFRMDDDCGHPDSRRRRLRVEGQTVRSGLHGETVDVAGAG